MKNDIKKKKLEQFKNKYDKLENLAWTILI